MVDEFKKRRFNDFFSFQIQTLAPVRTNRHYQHLRELTANDNALTSMSDLTGSHFLKNNPLVLNLQYNKITVVSKGQFGIFKSTKNKNFHFLTFPADF